MQAEIQRYCGWVKCHKNYHSALLKNVTGISSKAGESGTSLVQTEYPFTSSGYRVSVLEKFTESR